MPITLGELERRLDRVQPLAEQVPVLTALMAEIRASLGEVKDDIRAMKRAFYAAAISVMTSSVIFFLAVDRWLG